MSQGAFAWWSDPQPFVNGSTPESLETSRAGARAVADITSRQCLELLALYHHRGALTDQEAADALGWYRTTVIPRRNELCARGLVGPFGKQKNPQTGIVNTLWGIR